MCSIILRLGPDGTEIAANRDEMIDRPWQPPAAWWPDLPGVIAGRDSLAGGTWLGLNRHGVMAAVLNRHGSLGPAPNKRSRGELPLLALTEPTAAAAAAKIATLDASLYRSFNIVIADPTTIVFLRGLEQGTPEPRRLAPGTWMITSGEPNDASPRITRHLPLFAAAPFTTWPALLTDDTGPPETALNILPHHGFGTVCSSIIALPQHAPRTWHFHPIGRNSAAPSATPPPPHQFHPIDLT